QSSGATRFRQRESSPSECVLVDLIAHHPAGTFRDEPPTHLFIEEPRIVFRMRPDHTGAITTLIHPCECLAQQRAADARPITGWIDIQSVDLSVEVEHRVARLAATGHSDKAAALIFRNEYGFTARAHRRAPARRLTARCHGAQQSHGKNGCVSIVPGLDIDARDAFGVVGFCLAYLDCKTVHEGDLCAISR